MAEREDGTAKAVEVEMDGNRILEALQKAGLDFQRLDVKELLGGGADAEELESRLQEMATSTAESWEVQGGVKITCS